MWLTPFVSDVFDGLSIEVDNAEHDETLKTVYDVTDHRKLIKKIETLLSDKQRNIL